MADDNLWGRSRPEFSDLMPPTSDDDDEDGNGDLAQTMAMDRQPAAVSDPEENSMQVDLDHGENNRVTDLIDYPLPGYDGVPTGELNAYYVKEGLITLGQVAHLKKTYYTAWSSGEQHLLKFTCIFTCPVTGENFPAGNLDNEASIIDGVCWYKTKKLAINAASAKALDCFSLRRCHSTEKRPHQRCVDLPYLAEHAPELQDLPSGVELPEPLAQDISTSNGVSKDPPKAALHCWYMTFAKKLDQKGIVLGDGMDPNECGTQKDGASFSTWTNQKHSPHTLFTSVFTCHLSGERFASGKLGSADDYKVECMFYNDRDDNLIPIIQALDEGSDEAYDSDDVAEMLGLHKIYLVWYKTKKQAEHAAAARALDCFMHRESNNGTNPRSYYCEEEPYSVENMSAIWRTVSESVQRVGSVVWPVLPQEERLTAQFNVPDLQSFFDDEDDDEEWQARYKRGRMALRDATIDMPDEEVNGQ